MSRGDGACRFAARRFLLPLGTGFLGGVAAAFAQSRYDTSPLLGWSAWDLHREFSDERLLGFLAEDMLGVAALFLLVDLVRHLCRRLVATPAATRGVGRVEPHVVGRILLAASYGFLVAVAAALPFVNRRADEPAIFAILPLAVRVGGALGLVIFVGLQGLWLRDAAGRRIGVADRAAVSASSAVATYVVAGALFGLGVGQPFPLSWF